MSVAARRFGDTEWWTHGLCRISRAHGRGHRDGVGAVYSARQRSRDPVPRVRPPVRSLVPCTQHPCAEALDQLGYCSVPVAKRTEYRKGWFTSSSLPRCVDLVDIPEITLSEICVQQTATSHRTALVQRIGRTADKQTAEGLDSLSELGRMAHIRSELRIHGHVLAPSRATECCGGNHDVAVAAGSSCRAPAERPPDGMRENRGFTVGRFSTSLWNRSTSHGHQRWIPVHHCRHARARRGLDAVSRSLRTCLDVRGASRG